MHLPERRPIGNEPQVPGPLPALMADHLPAGVVDTVVVIGEGTRRLHGNVHCLESQIGEERTAVRGVRCQVTHHPVDQ